MSPEVMQACCRLFKAGKSVGSISRTIGLPESDVWRVVA